MTGDFSSATVRGMDDALLREVLAEVRAMRAEFRRVFRPPEAQTRVVVPVDAQHIDAEMPSDEDLLMWSSAGPLPSEIRAAEQATSLPQE